uniref:Enhancer of polycomb homolog n=1 Tax=Denticeps clupeoides TaxID=299321 RepID=A0AAY4A778_9TELE
MSKLSFRARALDATKPLPVFRCEDLPDLHEYASINRTVPQMPTGMEKEEETEHHLQRAISAQQVFGEKRENMVIPVPQAESNITYYESLYPGDFKMPKQLIHLQPFSLDAEQPDYDMDSEDEAFAVKLQKRMEMGELQFEIMIERLEKGSGQQLVTLQEAKLLLKEDDELIQEVFEYWSRKRRSSKSGTLIPTVRQEKRDGSSTNDPYVAFRRRTEKMQTRKNRKNDEVSYEKMLKLRRDLSRAVTILEMIKRREKSKRELLHLTLEIVEKRYFGSDVMAEVLAQRALVKPLYTLPILPLSSSNQMRHHDHLEFKDYKKPEKTEVVRTKRKYEKKQKVPPLSAPQHQGPTLFNPKDLNQYDFPSSDDETYTQIHSGSSEAEEENDPDGVFAFRRKAGCVYHAARLSGSGGWPWSSPDEGGSCDQRYRFSLMSLSKPWRCLGLARRRFGRGGRVVVDRAQSDLDSMFHSLESGSTSGMDVSPLYPSSISDSLSRSPPPAPSSSSDLRQVLLNIRSCRWRHFLPRRPFTTQSGEGLSLSRRPLRGVGRGGVSTPSTQARGTPTVVVTAEQYQQHQEQLVLMQKQLLEQEASQTSNNAQALLSQTLDSVSAQFAASALVMSDQLLNLKVKEEGNQGGGGVNGIVQTSGVYKGLILPSTTSSLSTTMVSTSVVPPTILSTTSITAPVSGHTPNAHLSLSNHGSAANSTPPVLIGNNLRLSVPASPITGLNARHLPRSLGAMTASALKLNNSCQIAKVTTGSNSMDLGPTVNSLCQSTNQA